MNADIAHDRIESVATIEWLPQESKALNIIDTNRLTEDGAEALALMYANTNGGWVVKRRLQRGERADWLLYRDTGVESIGA